MILMRVAEVFVIGSARMPSHEKVQQLRGSWNSLLPFLLVLPTRSVQLLPTHTTRQHLLPYSTPTTIFILRIYSRLLPLPINLLPLNPLQRFLNQPNMSA